ncbi:hypothetical protein [Carnobacterium maltaromaticum]|uniref:hypothetical protein n=2 Tax=Carnobacterium TaxID=2747 RepID=UPI0039BE0952
MTNLKNSNDTKNLAEKIALDDFDQLDKEHLFSDSYLTKKQLFMDEIKNKKPEIDSKKNKKRFLITAACLLLSIPTTAFAASKIYELIVEKQNYEVSVSVKNPTSPNQEHWYQLVINNLPPEMEVMKYTDNMKYSTKGNSEQGGLSFNLWKLDGNSNFSSLYSSNYTEMEINNRKAVIVTKENNSDFNRHVFLMFQQEGVMLESYIGSDISEEQMITILNGVALKSVSKEQASPISEYNSALMGTTYNLVEPTVIPLKENSKQLVKIGQKIPIQLENKLEYTIGKIEVFDSIDGFDLENFNEYGLSVLNKHKALNHNQFIPYQRDIYKLGDGKESINQLVDSKKAKLKFVYLTTTIKNKEDKSTEDIYMHPSLQVLKFENGGWIYAQTAGLLEETAMTTEVDYLEPHGEGKSFYNIGSILPNQTKEVKVGFFVDEDKLDSIFLDAFNYSGNSEDMNRENRWWVDLRQE